MVIVSGVHSDIGPARLPAIFCRVESTLESHQLGKFLWTHPDHFTKNPAQVPLADPHIVGNGRHTETFEASGCNLRQPRVRIEASPRSKPFGNGSLQYDDRRACILCGGKLLFQTLRGGGVPQIPERDDAAREFRGGFAENCVIRSTPSRNCLKVKIALVLITILAVSPVHSKQETIPDTPAGRVLAAWLEAFNDGDRTRIAAYQQEYEPTPSLPLDAVVAFRARTGGFDLVGIHKSERLRIEFLVKERASDTRAIGRFDVTPSDPPKVTTSGLRAISPGAAVIGFEIDAAVRERVIAGSIAKLNEKYVFPADAPE